MTTAAVLDGRIEVDPAGGAVWQERPSRCPHEMEIRLPWAAARARSSQGESS